MGRLSIDFKLLDLLPRHGVRNGAYRHILVFNSAASTFGAKCVVKKFISVASDTIESEYFIMEPSILSFQIVV